MRSSRCVPMLAAVATAAGASAPPAYAFRPGPIGSGAQPTAPLVRHHSSSSPDWILIGVGAAGGITLWRRQRSRKALNQDYEPAGSSPE